MDNRTAYHPQTADSEVFGNTGGDGAQDRLVWQGEDRAVCEQREGEGSEREGGMEEGGREGARERERRQAGRPE